MLSVENMRDITIDVILSGYKTRESIAQSIDNLILNVKCNMLSEELAKNLNEIRKHNSMIRQ